MLNSMNASLKFLFGKQKFFKPLWLWSDGQVLA